MSMLADAVNYVIASQHTGLSGPTRPVQMHKRKSTEPCIGRQQLIKHSQTIDGYTCVITGRNPRPRFLEALGTVDTGSRPQKPQYVPLRDALTMLSPLSLPSMPGKTSETGGGGKPRLPKPLKMIAFFTHQKLPKHRKSWSVIIYAKSGLSVRT